MSKSTVDYPEEYDYDSGEDVFVDDPDYDPGEDCGRWRNGRLGRHCASAGTEFCDFECPYRSSDAVKC